MTSRVIRLDGSQLTGKLFFTLFIISYITLNHSFFSVFSIQGVPKQDLITKGKYLYGVVSTYCQCFISAIQDDDILFSFSIF